MSKSISLKRLALVSLVSAMILPASAQGAFEIAYDGGDTDFKLSGSMDSKKAGQIVTLKVTDDQSNVIHARQTYTDANGSYEFVFSLGHNGEATATVSENGALFSKPIYKSTPGEVTSAVDRLAGDESIETVINEEADVLQVDPAEYAVLKEGGLLNTFLDAQEITSVADFKEAYNIGKFLVLVQKSDASGAVSMEDTYPEVKEALSSKTGNAYYGLNTTERKEIIGKLLGGTYSDTASYIKARDEALVIYLINAEENYNGKYKVIENNNDILGLDLESYQQLGLDFETFKEEFLEGSFTDVADLKDKAKAAYDDVTSGDGDDDGGSSSSGGSGGKTTSVEVSDKYTETQTIQPIIGFNDLAGFDWARTSVVKLAATGVINGKAEGIFAPADSVTRAEFVKMLSIAFGISGKADINFADVPAGHWAYDYVSASVANAVVTGVSADKFGTMDKITRQDMAVLCSRIMDMKKITAEGHSIVFDDADQIASYAKEGVDKLSKIGVINGVGSGRFAPHNFATRAEAAVIISRLQEYFGGR